MYNRHWLMSKQRLWLIRIGLSIFILFCFLGSVGILLLVIRDKYMTLFDIAGIGMFAIVGLFSLAMMITEEVAIHKGNRAKRVS